MEVGNKTLSKLLSLQSFNALVNELSGILPKSYTQYLTEFQSVSSASNVSRSAAAASSEFQKKLVYAEEAAGLAYKEPVFRRKSLRIGSWGIVILLASTVLDAILTYNRHKNPPAIDPNPDNLKHMLVNDPHSLKVYLLEPYPEITEFLYNYFKTIGPSIASFEALKKSLGND
ncbi:MAG: hypothetical protein R2877_03210 [Bdellovibrionota bacterium]